MIDGCDDCACLLSGGPRLDEDAVSLVLIGKPARHLDEIARFGDRRCVPHWLVDTVAGIIVGVVAGSG